MGHVSVGKNSALLKKCSALEEYRGLLAPSNRIGVKILGLPRPWLWGKALECFEKFKRAPLAPRSHMTARPPARTHQAPKFHPNSPMGHRHPGPRYHLGGLTFAFFQYRHLFYMHPQLGLTAVRKIGQTVTFGQWIFEKKPTIFARLCYIGRRW